MPKYDPNTDVILNKIPIKSPAGGNRTSYNVHKLEKTDKLGNKKEYAYCSLNIRIIKPGEDKPVWVDVGSFPEYMRHFPTLNAPDYENFLLKKDREYQCRNSLDHKNKFNLTGVQIAEGLKLEREYSIKINKNPSAQPTQDPEPGI